MDSHRDIGIAAALGGGTGTVLALALGQHWLPGALLGIMLGALIGGFSFRPREVAHVVWRVLHTQWRAFAWSAATLTILAGVVALFVFWPERATHITSAAIGSFLGINGWRHRTAVARAVVWLVGQSLAVAWGFGAFAVGAAALPLVVMWVGGLHRLDPLAAGIGLSLASVALLVAAWGWLGIWRVVASQASCPRWRWALIGWFLRLIQLDDKPTESDPSKPLIPTAWGSLRIDGQYARWQELRRLCRKTGELAFFAAIAPFMAVGLVVAIMADVPITIALALASSGRVAAMEGALIGSAAGFAASRLNATPLLAVAIGAAVAAASAIGLYRLRKALDARVEAAPA